MLRRYLFDGQTKEMLAFAVSDNGKKSGMIYGWPLTGSNIPRRAVSHRVVNRIGRRWEFADLAD